MSLPGADNFLIPTLQALREMGGSAKLSAIYGQVVDLMKLDDESLAETTKSGELLYKNRIRFARLILVKNHLVKDDSPKGLWELTEFGKRLDITKLSSHILRKGIAADNVGPNDLIEPRIESVVSGVDENDEASLDKWEAKLLKLLTTRTDDATYNRALDDKFERIVTALLRKMSVDMQKTQASNDYGLDGIGSFSIGGVLKEKIAFQAKRYALERKVGRPEIQSFLGALRTARIPRGIFVTTATFSAEAVRAASQEENAIQLIDGEELVELLKEYQLGVSTEVIRVEKVSLDESFFMEV